MRIVIDERESGTPEWVAERDVAYLICVEANRLEPQAFLLCESLRTFGGRYRDAPIFALSPRPELALDREARARLADLGVTYVVESLNRSGSSYGSINRIVAGAWAEAALDQPFLIVLDTDTVLVGAPSWPRADAAVRPVDVKGAASSGAADPLDDYWARMAAHAGIPLDRLPTLATTVDRVPVRASYNGGLTLVRRELGILRRSHEIFAASFAERLRPSPDSGLDVLASTGWVGLEAGEWWGSSQAALSLAIWSKTSLVRALDARYNVPLHSIADGACSWPTGAGVPPVLLHYHYLAEPQYQSRMRRALTLAGCSSEALRWIDRRLATFDTAALSAVALSSALFGALAGALSGAASG